MDGCIRGNIRAGGTWQLNINAVIGIVWSIVYSSSGSAGSNVLGVWWNHVLHFYHWHDYTEGQVLYVEVAVCRSKQLNQSNKADVLWLRHNWPVNKKNIIQEPVKN